MALQARQAVAVVEQVVLAQTELRALVCTVLTLVKVIIAVYMRQAVLEVPRVLHLRVEVA
jgi:hypothetical protein